MSTPIESKEQQFAVIEANANYLGAIAYRGYRQFEEKGTLILLRQLSNEGTGLEDWQVKFRPITYIDSMVSDWKEAGLQDLVIKYNPEVSVICTFLYPNGAHSSYHFSPEVPPPSLLQQLPQDNSGSE
ncbi:MAG: hypothetical protein BRC40_13105 [Cyanobacteria bacterium QH_8_48_120]|jgi:hypothetical protein|nr:MAG: hypothetical protein BRC34_02325 [Cyanobacteria bacterium QH_1_48_107]PSO58302.1 MAG: hypothetical protein BRC36_18205 [Cyanobacteria bacterium QH_2_48_84]PSO63087.1 MAG: hypothetical protein BRC38_14400 [Cyanobacteria bacterium QH_6_48_35]PSO70559.1 MAG: hypothetical protein BRC40_13105 [Cyanobacteria bacterium QH_8_48_120]